MVQFFALKELPRYLYEDLSVVYKNKEVQSCTEAPFL